MLNRVVLLLLLFRRQLDSYNSNFSNKSNFAFDRARNRDTKTDNSITVRYGI